MCLYLPWLKSHLTIRLNMKSNINPDNLGKLTLAKQHKDLKSILNKMSKSPSAEGQTATTSFYTKLSHRFACGKEHPLFILGAEGMAWKKKAKQSFRENKKEMLFGSGYLLDGVLYLEGTLGKLKLLPFQKATKVLMKKLGIARVQFVEKTDKAPAKEDRPSAGAQSANPPGISEQFGIFYKSFQQAKTILNTVKTGLSAQQLAVLETTIDLGQAFLAAYSNASPEQQKPFASKRPKIEVALATLKKRLAKLKPSKEQTATAGVTVKTEVKDAYTQLIYLLKAFKKI